MTRGLSVKRPTTKNIMQGTESESWPNEKDIFKRTLRFSKPVVKDGMKLTRNDSLAAREPIVNRTRNTSEITEDNTVKTTENGSTNIGDVTMIIIRNDHPKTLLPKTKKAREEYRAFWSLGPRVFETEKESSSQHYILWNSDGQDLLS